IRKHGGGERLRKPFGRSIRDQRSLTPAAQAAAPFADPQIAFAILGERANVVVAQSIARGPVTDALARQPADAVPSRAEPDVSIAVLQDDRDRSVDRGFGVFGKAAFAARQSDGATLGANPEAATRISIHRGWAAQFFGAQLHRPHDSGGPTKQALGSDD